ncbi:hypothetical protein TWF506_004667 [Arthrobotrys conoides]|uniref:C2H2-type domain-containing protein n=1 Tax=Arthrobotrys conoides TaxID=74498 RepID=A0AAN8N695_9PEZI
MNFQAAAAFEEACAQQGYGSLEPFDYCEASWEGIPYSGPAAYREASQYSSEPSTPRSYTPESFPPGSYAPGPYTPVSYAPEAYTLPSTQDPGEDWISMTMPSHSESGSPGDVRFFANFANVLAQYSADEGYMRTPSQNQQMAFRGYYNANSVSPDPDTNACQSLSIGSRREPIRRAGARNYKRNRRRSDLGPGRQRIRCNYDDCGLLYADRSSLLKHCKNKHWSQLSCSAACMYPECQSQYWGGTEQQARSNLRIHQRTHKIWPAELVEEKRCMINSEVKSDEKYM